MVKGRTVGNLSTSTTPGVEELKRSVERFQALMDEIPAGIVNVDIRGKITYVNKTILQGTGYSRDELVGKSAFQLGLIPRETLKLLRKRMKEKLMGKPPSPLEIKLKRKDGTWVWIEITGRALRECGVPVGVQVVGQDITERKRVEETLQESEEKFKTIFENVNDAIIYLDKYGRIIDINRVVEDVFGYKPDEVTGKHFIKLGFFRMRDVPKLVKLFAQAVGGSPVRLLEIEVKCKDGSTVLIETSTGLAKKGSKIEGVVVIARDITERKRMEEELRAAQEQLIRSERLAAIGQLAGGVGHELRNPLSAIKNAVYYIKGKVANSELGQREPRIMEFLDIIEDEVNSSNKIINDLLEFSRVRKPSVLPTRIEKIIEDALSHIAIPENIELIKKLDAGLPEINVDPDQIKQVVVNIITNAVEAMPEGGSLLIATRKKDKFLEVEVTDTGCGIPQESMDKIFDPLFTTKAKGIGLGLAVCKVIIDRHGGDIAVESKIGKGTTFNVKLPLKRE